MTLWFWDDLSRWNSKVSLCSEDDTPVSYNQLARLSDELSHRIGSTRQLVALNTANSTPCIIALIACLRARHPIILTSEATNSRILSAFAPNVVIDRNGNVSRHSDIVHDLHDDLALMLSTSGSTGATKLVRLSYTALHANAASIAEYLELKAGDVPITTLPIGYSYGLSVITSHLLSGARIVLTDRSVIDEGFWSLFEREAATSLAGVPRTYELLEAIGFRSRNLPSLRTMTQAGGALDAQLRKTYADWTRQENRRFFVMYGQTEATARIAYLPPDLQEEYPDCIGKAIPGGELRLVNEDGLAAPAGQTGELVYSGPNVMMGYATCIEDLREGPTIELLRTGDLARMAGPGIYSIVGRLSRFSKIAGLRVSHDEIEALLASHGIRSIAAGDDELVAICLEDEGNCPAAEALLDRFMSIPVSSRVIFALDEVPRLPSGKPDCPAVLAAGRRMRQALNDGPGTSANRMAAIYARALNRAQVNPSDSFASLGGDSLAYIEVSMAIERALGTLPDHWEGLSISRIEQLAAAASTAGMRRSVTVESEMLIRPVAMTTIVIGHAISSIDPAALGGTEAWQGGALALLLAAGFNTCRFQKARILSRDGLAVIFNYVKRVVIPYYFVLLWKVIVPLKSGYISLASLLLLSNYYYDENPFANQRYWFIEALFHTLLILTTILYIPKLNKWSKEKGFRFGVALFAAFFAIKLAVAAAMPIDLQNYLSHRWDAWAYAFAIGWAVAEARTRTERLACVALAIASSGLDWGFIDLHTVYLAAAAGLILFIPKVKLPPVVAHVAMFWAQSTFFIYLSHGAVFSIMEKLFHHFGIVSYVVASTVAGGAFYVAWRQIERISSPILRSLVAKFARGGGTQPSLSNRAALFDR